MNSPQIEVILPVYNAALTLRSAVESILKQTFGDFHIYLIDDGSNDDSPIICEQLCSQNSRITYIANSHNRGLVTRLNEGIALCSAPYVARMDADDISFPDRFQLQLDYLTANPHVIACSGSYQCIDAGGDVFDVHIATNKPSILNSIPARPHFLLHPLLMVRLDALIKIGGYRNVLHCEDADLYYRLGEHGKLHNLPDILGQYRVHDASVSIVTEANRIIQCINSQLLSLCAFRKLKNPPGNFPPEYISEQIAKIISTEEPSLASTLEHAQNLLQLDRKDYNWLKLAAYTKYFQESRFRKFTIAAQDFDTATSLIKQIFTYPPKQHLSFLIHFRKWHVSCPRVDRKNKYHLNLLCRFVLTVERIRTILYQAFHFMAGSGLRAKKRQLPPSQNELKT